MNGSDLHHDTANDQWERSLVERAHRAGARSSSSAPTAWQTDWRGLVKLAVVFSVVAALAAITLAGRVPETTIVCTIIVVGTMLSWSHLEQVPAPSPVRWRTHRRH